MTKIEKVVKAVSDLRDFYRKIQKQKKRNADEKNDEPQKNSPE
jgi:hypothetical protein